MNKLSVQVGKFASLQVGKLVKKSLSIINYQLSIVFQIGLVMSRRHAVQFTYGLNILLIFTMMGSVLLPGSALAASLVENKMTEPMIKISGTDQDAVFSSKGDYDDALLKISTTPHDKMTRFEANKSEAALPQLPLNIGEDTTLLKPGLAEPEQVCVPASNISFYLSEFNSSHIANYSSSSPTPPAQVTNAYGPADSLTTILYGSNDRVRYWSFSPSFILSGTIQFISTHSNRTNPGLSQTARFESHSDKNVDSDDVGWQGWTNGNIEVQQLGSIRVRNKGGVTNAGWTALDAIELKLIDGCYFKVVESIPTDQTFAPNECPFCGNEEKQNFVGGSINSFSGNLNHQNNDISIPTLGAPLRFDRSYNSLATMTNTVVYSRPLGYGWTHNYDINLTIGLTRTILKASHGSRLRFSNNIDGSYTAYPGIRATMTRSLALPYVYTVTAANQEIHVFTQTGKLINHIDPQGNETEFTYSDSITLTRVTGPSNSSDPSEQRYLDFSYNDQGLLIAITDHTSRSTRYGYDAFENMIVMTDTRNMAWTYVYTSPPPHTVDPYLLHQIIDPEGLTNKKTFFDEEGRVIRQENGLGDTLMSISYVGDQRVISENGKVYTDTYNSTGLLIGQVDAANNAQNYDFDDDYNRTYNQDAKGNTTTSDKTWLGQTTAITNALGNLSEFEYDDNNNLIKSTDAKE